MTSIEFTDEEMALLTWTLGIAIFKKELAPATMDDLRKLTLKIINAKKEDS
jgi:hypothetical protein